MIPRSAVTVICMSDGRRRLEWARFLVGSDGSLGWVTLADTLVRDPDWLTPDVGWVMLGGEGMASALGTGSVPQVYPFLTRPETRERIYGVLPQARLRELTRLAYSFPEAAALVAESPTLVGVLSSEEREHYVTHPNVVYRKRVTENSGFPRRDRQRALYEPPVQSPVPDVGVSFFPDRVWCAETLPELLADESWDVWERVMVSPVRPLAEEATRILPSDMVPVAVRSLRALTRGWWENLSDAEEMTDGGVLAGNSRWNSWVEAVGYWTLPDGFLFPAKAVLGATDGQISRARAAQAAHMLTDRAVADCLRVSEIVQTRRWDDKETLLRDRWPYLRGDPRLLESVVYDMFTCVQPRNLVTSTSWLDTVDPGWGWKSVLDVAESLPTETSGGISSVEFRNFVQEVILPKAAGAPNMFERLREYVSARVWVFSYPEEVEKWLVARWPGVRPQDFMAAAMSDSSWRCTVDDLCVLLNRSAVGTPARNRT